MRRTFFGRGLRNTNHPLPRDPHLFAQFYESLSPYTFQRPERHREKLGSSLVVDQHFLGPVGVRVHIPKPKVQMRGVGPDLEQEVDLMEVRRRLVAEALLPLRGRVGTKRGLDAEAVAVTISSVRLIR